MPEPIGPGVQQEPTDRESKQSPRGGRNETADEVSVARRISVTLVHVGASLRTHGIPWDQVDEIDPPIRAIDTPMRSAASN